MPVDGKALLSPNCATALGGAHRTVNGTIVLDLQEHSTTRNHHMCCKRPKIYPGTYIHARMYL
ncbi:hypothetical protein Rmet_6604 [Cupriavidus metallidurans CH34]|uniref:Uncharacterized protein n=1 Tax=Cupriavidus metallidurans (strain ATCC 43123 / DSM 2839 / NBRC 102507 / CH34) TaxID=266264 RepID=D3DY35_CUPMC|nr:hypothetical protein Rmet_6604 [Cupriavidus metallidurans CH34]